MSRLHLHSSTGKQLAKSVPIDEDWDKADCKAETGPALGGSLVAGKRSRVRGSRGKLPPSLNVVMTVRSKMLYSNLASAALTSVGCRALLQSCGGICTVANTTIQPWASSMRLHKITIWPAPLSSAIEECQVLWATSSTVYIKDELRIRVLPEGVTETGPTVFVPPSKSLASDWFADQNLTLFKIAAPINSVVEVESTFTLSGGANSPSVGTAGATSATLGNVYYPSLDGAKVYTVQGLTTIV